MKFHWGDFVFQATLTHGALALGIDPVRGAVPKCFFGETAAGDDAWLLAYVEFLLNVATGHVAIVKFQSAYFEALGSQGVLVLAQCISIAKQLGFGVILDAKRGDIGSTAEAYARAYLTPVEHGGTSDLEVDCITVNPYLGPDTLNPYLACAQRFGKGVFVLAKTSNPGSAWLQDQVISSHRVSEIVAKSLQDASSATVGLSGLSNVGIVVGATYPEDGLRFREILPYSIFLVPGVGAQGGSAETTKRLLTLSGSGVIVPVSRGITEVKDLCMTLDEYRRIIRRRLKALSASLDDRSRA